MSDNERPPLTVDTLAAAIVAHKEYCIQNRRHWPVEIPYEAIDAAKWWIGIQPKPDEYLDRPRQVSVVGGSTRWESPYALRLCHNFRAYCGLDEHARNIVQAASQDGVFWNGDRITWPDGKPAEFVRIYDETLKMREVGAAEYRKTLIPKLRQALEKMAT